MAASEKNYYRGLRISNRRKELGLSQDELAHRVGIGRQALSAIENGGDFKVTTLGQLVSALNVTAHFILDGSDDTKLSLMEEAQSVLQGMNEMQIQQIIEMMKILRNDSEVLQ